jgi:hypothetical protein
LFAPPDRTREASRNGDQARLRPGAGLLRRPLPRHADLALVPAAGALDGEVDASAVDQVGVVAAVDGELVEEESDADAAGIALHEPAAMGRVVGDDVAHVRSRERTSTVSSSR